MARRKTMITMGSPYFAWINANEIISPWYLLGAVCVTPPENTSRFGAGVPCGGRHRGRREAAPRLWRRAATWEKQVPSAREFKRVGKHSDYAISTVWRCVKRGPGGPRRGPGGSSEPLEPPICFTLAATHRLGSRRGVAARPPRAVRRAGSHNLKSTGLTQNLGQL
jgi:hypothetical protein